MIQITPEQALEFLGQKIGDSWYCNPIQDVYGNWYISEVEADALDVSGPFIETIELPLESLPE